MPLILEPNIHPVLVHFAYALMTTGALALLASALAVTRRDSLRTAADWMIAFGAIAIMATVAAGFQAYYSVAHDGPSHAAMTTHRNWAVPTATVLLALSIWRFLRRKEAPSLAFALLFAVAAASLSVTAWWGGRLVYGHGLGVASLPAAEGKGHDHDHHHQHSDVEGHDDDAMTTDHDDAHDHHGDAHVDEAAAPEDAPQAARAEGYPETPEAVVDAFAAALKAGDEAAVRALLLPDVIIAEGGGAERSLDEYASHHMPADMEFTNAMTTTVKDREVLASGDIASVISQSEMHGEFQGKHLHLRMMETMMLRQESGRWRIAHIHWSSAPIAGEHEH